MRRALALTVLVRATGLVALSVLLAALAASDDGPDANIGLGLLLLALQVLAASAWAGADGVRAGRRARRPGPLLLAWAVVAVVVGVAQAVEVSVAGALAGGGFSAGVLAGDLAGLAPLVAVLVAVAALAAAAVGLAGARPATPSSP